MDFSSIQYRFQKEKKTGKKRKKEQDEKKEEETTKIVKDQEGMKRIAAEFYRKLWRKGHISNRKKEAKKEADRRREKQVRRQYHEGGDSKNKHEN